MNESEDNFTERGEGEIGTRAILPDDNCNHLACILWDMRSRANLRKPFTPRPKPQYTGNGQQNKEIYPKDCAIGKRSKYPSSVMLGIFQLHRNGVSQAFIASLLGMPAEDVKKIMSCKTQTANREFMRCRQQASNPTTEEIVRRLAMESQYVYGNPKKAV